MTATKRNTPQEAQGYNAATKPSQIFNIIDERDRSGKPLIITTNIPLTLIKNPSTLYEKRVYSRIDKMSIPVSFGDKGCRQAIAAAKMRRAAELLK